MKFIGIIPARFASTRFPGKPLAMLGDKPVIQHVYEKVSAALEEAYVATDDTRIYDAVVAFGGKAVMTRSDHKSGTDRIEEAIEKIGGDWDVIVNVQGDEPFVAKSQLNTICHCFDDEATQIATLGKPFTSMDAVANPNSPKIVVDNFGFAMYFSRSIIPSSSTSASMLTERMYCEKSPSCHKVLLKLQKVWSNSDGCRMDIRSKWVRLT